MTWIGASYDFIDQYHDVMNHATRIGSIKTVRTVSSLQKGNPAKNGPAHGEKTLGVDF